MKRTPKARSGAMRKARIAVAAALTGAILLTGAAPSLAAAPAAAAPLRFGAAWYPEQWPETRWEADLALMQAAHINVVRVGEFAWSALEPKAGQFDFGWLDRAIAAAAAHHIAVVLGTPTAAPPAWLTRAYPDVLRVDEDGTRAEHGGRQQFSLASPRYRQFARRIAEQMAIHYGHSANVLGWQIDNEIGVDSFDPAVRDGFHRWLAARYGSIAALNRRWATAYWSQTYDDFDEVPLHTKDENPALLLDLRRYFSDTWNSYVQDQAGVIRAHSDAAQFVTTNTQHWDAAFDHYKLHQGLDIAAWDEYVPDGHYVWLDQAELLGHGDPACLRELGRREPGVEARSDPRNGLAGGRPRR
jgi:beta-galactosidase